MCLVVAVWGSRVAGLQDNPHLKYFHLLSRVKPGSLENVLELNSVTFGPEVLNVLLLCQCSVHLIALQSNSKPCSFMISQTWKTETAAVKCTCTYTHTEFNLFVSLIICARSTTPGELCPRFKNKSRNIPLSHCRCWCLRCHGDPTANHCADMYTYQCGCQAEYRRFCIGV